LLFGFFFFVFFFFFLGVGFEIYFCFWGGGGVRFLDLHAGSRRDTLRFGRELGASVFG